MHQADVSMADDEDAEEHRYQLQIACLVRGGQQYLIQWQWQQQQQQRSSIGTDPATF